MYEEEGKVMGRHRRSDAGRAAGSDDPRASTTGNDAPRASTAATDDAMSAPTTPVGGHDQASAPTAPAGSHGPASTPTGNHHPAGGPTVPTGGQDPAAEATVPTGGHDPASVSTVPIPMGTAPYLNPEAYAAAKAKADAYLFAAGPAEPFAGDAGSPYAGADAAGEGAAGSGEPARGKRRPKQAGRAVSMTLLGMCVAVALGTAAVAAGVVPGFQGYRLDGSSHTAGGDRVRVAGSPSNTADAQGGTSGSAENGGTDTGGTDNGGGGTAAGRGTGRSLSSPAAPTQSSSPAPGKSASPTRSAPASPAPSKSAKPTAPRTTPAAPAAPEPTPSPSRAKPGPAPTKTAAPAPTVPPVTVSAQAAAEAEVLKLINDERAKAGLAALSANSALTNLAGAFSDDMAARGFFSDTDPDGKSPWDRAAAAGVSGLGAENIARGPADPAAVVKAWMASPEHRADILNPAFHTLGVGVHFGAGGPWWTAEFGN
ncbi:CAP domain-containing protein [Streptomyces sp. AM6-12]|uniref:CAP domain-containing protein n=1 Tax=Streptomyces sp. AM6-12 TaxID=3345149 RepID=UPI00379F3CD7